MITFLRFFSSQKLCTLCEDTVPLGHLLLVRMVRAMLWHPRLPSTADDQGRVWELSGLSGAWYEQADVRKQLW